MFRVYCEPLTSYMRCFICQNGGLSIFSARVRLEPEVTSPFDSSTADSSLCSVYILCLAGTIR
jgi:hypothetical protein